MVDKTGDSGVVVERNSYDVFGEPNRVSDLGNPYMFTGREYDSETGLYYYRARYYTPWLGRFLQTDPIGYEDGLNLYHYVNNSPIIHTDPSGLSCQDDCDKTFNDCMAWGKAIRDTCLKAVADAFDTCKNDCDRLPFPLNLPCLGLCASGAGAAAAGCISAYSGWTSGCVIGLAWCYQSCGPCPP